jgi:RHS repeat-associated protein
LGAKVGQLAAVILPAVVVGASTYRPRWEYKYNQFGSLQQIRDNIAQVSPTDIRYDHNGVAGDDTRTTNFQFDSLGRQRFRILPSGLQEEMRYDDFGRQVLHISFEGRVKRSVYSDIAQDGGRMVREEYFRTLADYNAFVAGSGLAAGKKWEQIRSTVDGFGRTVNVTHAYHDGANASQQPTTIVTSDVFTNAYDAEGRVIQETSPAGKIRYEYDVLGRKTRTFTEPTAAATVITDVTYQYNSLSRLSRVTTVTRNGQPVDSNTSLAGNQPEVTNYFFDLLGRMDRTELPGGVVEDYTFDAMDRLDKIAHFQSDADNTDLSNNPRRALFDYAYLADGRRSQLQETFWLDTDNNAGTADVPRTTQYDWVYDAAGRLTQESINHWTNAGALADAVDLTETFTLDLVGNRTMRSVNRQGTANDQSFVSTYDVNDRIIEEKRFANLTGTGAYDQRTLYTFTSTEQTGKLVKNGSDVNVSQQLITYGLTGQLEQVISELLSGATVNERKRVQYRYDDQGIRFLSIEATDANKDGDFIDAGEPGDTTEYLIDHQNATGYAQTITELVKNASGQPTKRTTYIFGTDEITQTVATLNPSTGLVTGTPVTLTFGHDGHGSVRVLFDTLGAISQIATYSAYGQMLAVHNRLSALVGTTEATFASTLGYSGEPFDARIGQQYLRARFYTPSTGRFDRLDPFAGNANDPFSFHKYGFVHGDPVMGIDPTGLMTLSSSIAGISVGSILMAGVSGYVLAGIYAANQFGFIETPDEPTGFVEGMVPFWGSGKNFLYNINNGNYLSATANALFFMTDFLLAKSAVKLIQNAATNGWKAMASPGVVWAVWGLPQKVWASRAPNHFMWQVGRYVYDATRIKGVMTVTRELAENSASYATWRLRLSIPLPAIFTQAANTCGATGGSCLTNMITALEAAGVPEVLQTLVKSVYAYEESDGL